MLFAAFPNHAFAQRAVEELTAHGFDADTLSVITKHDHSVAADTAAGAAGGIAAGGVLGGLAGLLAGAGVFPALAGLMIGGPLAAALGLTGVAAVTVSGAVTGAAAGGLVGALAELGFSSSEATQMNRTVEEGGILLAVSVTDRNETEARHILVANQAQQTKELMVNRKEMRDRGILEKRVDRAATTEAEEREAARSRR